MFPPEKKAGRVHRLSKFMETVWLCYKSNWKEGDWTNITNTRSQCDDLNHLWPREILRHGQFIFLSETEGPGNLDSCLRDDDALLSAFVTSNFSSRSLPLRRRFEETRVSPRETTIGWCNSRLSCLPESVFARAAICLSQASLDLQQISLICSCASS
jgi:hypothetical protein